MDQRTKGLLERVRRYAMPEGPVEFRSTWMRQKGEIRLAIDSPWLPFDAEQWFEGSGIDFRWHARVRMASLAPARVVDSFEDGRGSLTVRAFGWIPVAGARGPETDKGEALRGLAELAWRPFAFKDSPWFTWESSAENKLRVTFDNRTTRAVADFDVDDNGRVLGGGSSTRPRIVGKSVVETPWTGTFADYQKFDGLMVPTAAEATWILPEGAFTYWRGRVTEFRAQR